MTARILLSNYKARRGALLRRQTSGRLSSLESLVADENSLPNHVPPGKPTATIFAKSLLADHATTALEVVQSGCDDEEPYSETGEPPGLSDARTIQSRPQRPPLSFLLAGNAPRRDGSKTAEASMPSCHHSAPCRQASAGGSVLLHDLRRSQLRGWSAQACVRQGIE